MNKKKVVKNFEHMTLMARAKYFSNLSLTRPLTNTEFKDYKETIEKIKGI